MEKDTMPTKEIGQRIAKRRDELRMSQAGLGNLLKRKVKGATIGQWEAGRLVDFPIALLDEIAGVLHTSRDFLETGVESDGFSDESDSVAPLHGMAWKVPLVAFASLSRARLNAVMSEAMAKRRFHTTSFPVPNGGIAFKMLNDSMKPIDKGCTVTIAFGIEPQPGDCVVAEWGGITDFRRFTYSEDGRILLSPTTPGWKKYEFTEDQWAGVDVIGVMTAYEKQTRSV